MSIVVNTNVSSMMVTRNLNQATMGLNTSIERMSTGLKINKAADDAAGLTISKGLETQVRGAGVATQNAQVGINLLQTAEGDLSVMQDNLQRVRDLSVQAANGTYSTSERLAIEKEIEARFTEIDRIANGSSFNDIKLFDTAGSDDLRLQVGADATDSITVSGVLTDAECSDLGITTAFTAGAAQLSDAATAASFISQVDTAIENVSTRRTDIGAYQNRMASTIDSLTIRAENLTAAKSRILDADIAQESASFTTNQILQQASTSLLSQANQSPSIALSLI